MLYGCTFFIKGQERVVLKIGDYKILAGDTNWVNIFRLPVTDKTSVVFLDEYAEVKGVSCFNVFKCNYIIKEKQELEVLYKLTFKELLLTKGEQPISYYDVCTFEYSNRKFTEKKKYEAYEFGEKGLIFRNQRMKRNILKKGGFISLRLRSNSLKNSPIYVTFFFEGTNKKRIENKYMKYLSRKKFLYQNTQDNCIDNNESWKWGKAW